MKYALINGQRVEAQKGLKGECPGCNSKMIAKCGAVKIPHWSHAGKIDCDPWWENETQWHRTWKGHFPAHWQEVVHKSDSGEFHRADVKTEQNWVLEIQYSAISSVERESRNSFYGKLVWIVNGLRLKRDPFQFFSALKVATTLENQFIRRICDVVGDKSSLVQNWCNTKVPVFFDFNEPDVLWCLLPQQAEESKVVVEFWRKAFIGVHQTSLESNLDNFGQLIQFLGAPNSANELIQKFHEVRRAEERRRQLAADEARRNNPYRNHRANRRL